jgi:predicted regulator of Ras-like GTPase activity (Roadblock/LC7/MglB family)
LFEKTFKQLYEKNKEIKVMGVWGKDGLELEKKFFPEDRKDIDLDVEFSGAEVADIVSRLDSTKTSSSSDTFFMKLDLHGSILMIFSLTREYFLLVLAEKTVIEGRLKFYVDVHKDRLIAAL